MECVFCTDSAIAARKIAENDSAWAIPTNIPITRGHSLILPKRHVGTFSDLTDAELIDIRALAESIKKALRAGFGAEGFNCAWNEGRMAGQSIPHFHLHVVPRATGDTGIYEYEPRSFLYQTSSNRPVSEEDELRGVAAKIRAAMAPSAQAGDALIS